MTTQRTLWAVVAVAVVLGSPTARMRQEPRLAPIGGTVRMAVIGDNGTGDREQYDVGRQLVVERQTFPFDLVIMLGDNMLGSQEPADFVTKFERPYAPLRQAGVQFRAALGNHDRPDNYNYAPFGMGGQRYYSYVKAHVRFFVLDTNTLDDRQLAWADAVLAEPHDGWRVVYFHHAIYSNGRRHGSDLELRVRLEPLFLRHGVHVVFSGHDHVYERLVPQKGITYFVVGSSGKLRKGDVKIAPSTAAAFDDDQSFMLVEFADSRMSFRAISRTGRVVDSGTLTRPNRSQP